MGTKIVERIAIKGVAESENIGFRISQGRRVDERSKCLQSKELRDELRCRVSSSMDRFLDNQNLESIRKTMQAQEEIFKHQVQELHRVYSVQKMMMEELKKEIKQRRHRTNRHPNLTSQQQTASYNNNNNFFLLDNNSNNNNNQSWRETSGSCSGIDLESPAREISAVDHGRPTRTNGSDQMEERELELTLSIGMSSSSTSKSYNQRETTTNNRDMDSSTTSFRSDNCNMNHINNNNNNNNNNQDCSGPTTPMSSSSTTLDQEKKRPHWLFQGLSINRT